MILHCMMPAPVFDRRLLGADFVRAAACLMVLGHHLAQRLRPQAVPEDAITAYETGLTGAFGVAAFFVLSGFLLARPFWQALDAGRPMPSLGTYAIRRAARIVPAFWFALIVTFVLSITLFSVPLDGLLIFRFLAGLFLISDWHWSTLFPVEFNGPLWSIGFEVTSYVLLPLTILVLFLLPRRTVASTRLAWIAVLALVISIQWLVVQYLPVETHMRGWQYGLLGGAKVWVPRFNPVGFFAIFAIGILAAAVQVRWSGRRSASFDLLALGGLGIALWSIGQAIGDREVESYGLAHIPYAYPWFPVGVAVVLAALPSSTMLGWLSDNAAVRFVARISFGIYLWHYLVIEVLRQLVFPGFTVFGVTDVAEWFGASAAVVVISVALGALSFYALEQPVIRWARGLEPAPSTSARAAQTGAA